MPSAGEKESVKELAVFCFGAIATLFLAAAGIAGIDRPQTVLWTVFGAGVCYALAFQTAHFNTVPHKGRITAVIICICVIASVSAQIWLITHQKALPLPAPLAVTPKSPVNAEVQTAPIEIKGDGNAVATGLNTSASVSDGHTPKKRSRLK